MSFKVGFTPGIVREVARNIIYLSGRFDKIDEEYNERIKKIREKYWK